MYSLSDRKGAYYSAVGDDRVLYSGKTLSVDVIPDCLSVSNRAYSPPATLLVEFPRVVHRFIPRHKKLQEIIVRRPQHVLLRGGPDNRLRHHVSHWA